MNQLFYLRKCQQIMQNAFLLVFLLCFLGIFRSTESYAGVFDLPGFLEPGQFALGLEPEIAVSQGAGAAVNLKPRLGINDHINVQLLLGTGVGDRRFRVGGIADFEWFPDVSWQPGLATPITLQYMNVRNEGEVHLFFTPLVYKTFARVQGMDYTPFIGVPVGWAARDGNLRGITQLAVGTMMRSQSIKYFRFVIEAGFNIHRSYSYISGGVVFYPAAVKESASNGTGQSAENGANNNGDAPVRVVPPPKE